MVDLRGEVVVTASAPTMYSGDSRTLPFTIALPEGGDLNGSTLRWQCARKHSGGFGPAVISKALGNGITVTDTTGGALEVALTPADTAGLAGRFIANSN